MNPKIKVEIARGGVFVYRPRELSELEEVVKQMEKDKADGIQSTVKPGENSWLEVQWDFALTLIGHQKDDLPW